MSQTHSQALGLRLSSKDQAGGGGGVGGGNICCVTPADRATSAGLCWEASRGVTRPS